MCLPAALTGDGEMKYFDKRKRNRDNDEDDYEVQDGQTVRIGLLDGSPLQRAIAQHAADHRRQTIPVVDTAFHVPGYVQVADSPALRDARKAAMDARREYVSRTTSAWCGNTGYVEPPRPTSVADANAMRREARDSYIERTVNAWRTPVRDGAQPDLGMTFSRVSPEQFSQALARGGDPSMLQPPRRPADPQAMKEAAYNERNRQLTNAWRSPAAAANEVERQRRRWTHEDRR
jgi:hypothetical protein